MNRKDIISLWNDCLSADDEPIRLWKRSFPWFRIERTKEHEIDRTYADGGIRYRTEIKLKAAAVCFCTADEDALIDELHRRITLLCDRLPASVGKEELILCEMLHRPSVLSRAGGATVVQTSLRLTLRKPGECSGVSFFFGATQGKLFAPVGFFSPVWERKAKEAVSQYFNEPSTRSLLFSAQDRLRFQFDRIIGADAQELILLASDRQARGASAVIQVYFADVTGQAGESFPCVRQPMTVIINQMTHENAGIVFGGELAACGKRTHGRLQKDEKNQWTFSFNA